MVSLVYKLCATVIAWVWKTFFMVFNDFSAILIFLLKFTNMQIDNLPWDETAIVKKLLNETKLSGLW